MSLGETVCEPYSEVRVYSLASDLLEAVVVPLGEDAVFEGIHRLCLLLHIEHLRLLLLQHLHLLLLSERIRQRLQAVQRALLLRRLGDRISLDRNGLLCVVLLFLQEWIHLVKQVRSSSCEYE